MPTTMYMYTVKAADGSVKDKCNQASVTPKVYTDARSGI